MKHNLPRRAATLLALLLVFFLAVPGSRGPRHTYPSGDIVTAPLAAGNGLEYSPSYKVPHVSQPQPRPGITGAGAVLVLTDPINHFSDYLCGAILPAKGFACASTDAGNLESSEQLAPYHTVVLENGSPLSGVQIALVTRWVARGGNFIAMRPDDNLDGLLGVGQRRGVLPDAYLKIDTTQPPGAGIDGQALQYHGLADQHELARARAVATLYADVATPTPYSAVTIRVVGALGGTASAWMFDLARSNVFTREGSPTLAGRIATSNLSPTGPALPRMADRFGLGYLEPRKAAVPQADLQVTLLANMIQGAGGGQYPVPVKWIMPSYKPGPDHPGGLLKAALILTGDDHASPDSQTLARFRREVAASPAGCSVAMWTCIRSTSYAYPKAFSDAAVKPYTDVGFEVAPHVADNERCAWNWSTRDQLDAIAAKALREWSAGYPAISAAHPPITERFHCYGVWNDYASVAKVEAAHGLMADTNSSCWPGEWLKVSQCLFTGTGLPQELADADGKSTGVAQFTTVATDDNPGTVSQTALAGLIANAVGAKEYYGYFTVLAHLDNLPISDRTEQAVLAVAREYDVPVVSAAQAQEFWAARAATSVSAPAYTSSTATFTDGTPAANLLLLQPAHMGAKSLQYITRGATTVSFTVVTLGGVSYAAFPAATAGTYTVTYG